MAEAAKLQPLTVDVPTAGWLLAGLGRNGSYAAAARGDIPTMKIGGRLRVSRAEIERLTAAKPSEKK